MKKGLGHFTSTSVWNGNVAVCGHNRGAKYVIGSIKIWMQAIKSPIPHPWVPVPIWWRL